MLTPDTTESLLLKRFAPQFTAADCIVAHHRIHYIRGGSGKTLVLLHGSTIGWGMWFKIVSELSKVFTVYAFDLPGAGRSSLVDMQKLDPTRDYVDVLRQCLEQLDLSGYVVGSSIGGWVAMELARCIPERITAYAVLNGVGFSGHQSFVERLLKHYSLAQLIAKTILRTNRENRRLEAFLRSTFFNTSLPLPAEFINYYYESMQRSHNILFISRLLSLSGKLQHSAFAQNLMQPACIIWGEHDPVMPLNQNEPGFSIVPRAQRFILHSSGHFPSIEQSEDVTHRLVEFFTRT
jgi:pimeloyl-ACP methyl ester carboxylesterase